MNIVNLKIGEKIFKSRMGTTYRAEQNQRLWIEFDEERMILFDKETGKAFKHN
jgi:hypothetical protein